MIQTLRHRIGSPTLVACGVAATLLLGGVSTPVAWVSSVAAATALATVDAIRGSR